jgi:hypothetical protein
MLVKEHHKPLKLKKTNPLSRREEEWRGEEKRKGGNDVR